MSAQFSDAAREYESLLSDDFSNELSSRDNHALPLLKVVICANLILLVVFASALAFGGYIDGSKNDQSLLSGKPGLKGYIANGIRLMTGYVMEAQNPDWACLCEVVHSQFPSLHLKLNEIALIQANIHGFTKYLADLVKLDRIFTNSFNQFWFADGSEARKSGEMPRPNSPQTRVSRMSRAILKEEQRRSHTLRKVKIASFLKIMKDLSREGLLQSHQRVLCLDSSAGRKMRVLKKKGFNNLEHVDVSLSPRGSNQNARNPLKAFTDQFFDLVFTTVFDYTTKPGILVAEIERVLKVGGLAAMHVSLNAWHNKYIRAIQGDGEKPVTVLFTMSKIVYVSAAYAPGLDTLIVFKKTTYIGNLDRMENISADDLSQVDRKHVSLSEEAADISGSLTTYECRKCIKQRDSMSDLIVPQ